MLRLRIIAALAFVAAFCAAGPGRTENYPCSDQSAQAVNYACPATVLQYLNSGGQALSVIATAPVVSASAENNHVLKATPGNLFSVSASNLTSTAGFLVWLDASSAPADGAITPKGCVPLPASGTASISYMPGPPAAAATGITVVVSSGANCFTKTTGTITAFISGMVQ